MGSRIAMHFANAGVQVVLLDIVPRELTEKEQAAGLTLEHPSVRNRIVKELFQKAAKGKPSPIYDTRFLDRIELGNLTDDLPKLADCDWILEAVVERLDIKHQVYEQVEAHRKPGTLITTNTSGIPMQALVEGRSQDFRAHFCGTHFFNPPRYLELLEVIPGPDTQPEVVDFLAHYGDRFLGKKVVRCKDTPAFIANRVGVFAIFQLFHLTEKYGLTVEEVDQLTGKLIGHPKSATFRTLDVVGLDTTVEVAKRLQQVLAHDERKDVFAAPAYVQQMLDKQLFGDKTGKGFYQKVKQADGSSEIQALNLQTFEYAPREKAKNASLGAAKQAGSPAKAMLALVKGEDTHAAFFREFLFGLLAYAAHRVPEIADAPYQIDEALKAGFGWQHGPFEKWDALGVAETAEQMAAAGYAYPDWVNTILAQDNPAFYRVENGQSLAYRPQSQDYQPIPGQGGFLLLDNLRHERTIWKNDGASLIDLGDGILNLEFHTKMNAMGGEVMDALNHALDLAEAKYDGLVIANEGENFSAGANIALILMTAFEQEWQELNWMINGFQQGIRRVRYSRVPVVVAPHALTLGGGCELTMHADAVQASAETYIGLVEVGVGLIPGGGGTKEFAKRLGDRYREGDVSINAFSEALMTLGQAKVATSAHEAYGLGYLQPHKDHVTVGNARRLADAKARCLQLAAAGYTQPIETPVRVLGKTVLGAVEVWVETLRFQGYASEHDANIARKLGQVLAGGDLLEGSQVTEQYLLDLEREAFLSLCGERKTLERLQHMLNTGKPLRN